MSDPRLFVTFDTNTYSVIANPQPRKLLEKWMPMTRDRWKSKKTRVAWWYLSRCIRTGRIVAGIPEALLATEALQQVDRVQLLCAVGTSIPRPPISAGRINLIEKALGLGFRVMIMPRIGHPTLYILKEEDKAVDVRHKQADRITRSHAFSQQLNDYAFDAVKDFGESLAKVHGLTSSAASFAAPLQGISICRYLWREGLAAEQAAPKSYSTQKAFETALRHLLADWTDFDVVATHYGYGYDYLCTEDLGSQSSNSVFGPQHNIASYNIKVINAVDLAKLALKRFWFPFRKWSPPKPSE